MEACFKDGYEMAKGYIAHPEDSFPNLVAGSNIAEFTKAIEAIRA